MEEKMKIEYIPIENIRPNPYQPRTRFTESSLNELAQSIEQYGVLQPINVRKFSEDSYELIAGERRLRAAKIAGLGEIPALVNEVLVILFRNCISSLVKFSKLILFLKYRKLKYSLEAY